MMAGNPSWWSMQSELRSTNDNHHQDHHHEQSANNLFLSQTHPSNNDSLLSNTNHHQYLHGSSSTSSSSSSLMPFISLVENHHHAQDFPHHSWSQLLLGGMASEQEEERFISTTPSHFQSTRVVNNDVKAEVCSQNNNNCNNNLYGNQYLHEDQQQEASLGLISNRAAAAWTQLMPASSPKSCITTLSSKNNIHNDNIDDNNHDNNNNNVNNNSNNMLDFTNKRSLQADECHQHIDHSNSECNSSATTGGVLPNKKPRTQSSSNPPLKVRKEKLGDKITSLHQLVSPFGKTDTASVLLEAIGYIRFLQGQIEALSSPYLGSNNIATINNVYPVHGERNCLFPDHPGQLLNDSCMKRRGAANQEAKQGASKDLKSRGLCLVPISCTQLVGSDNGADYWAQSLGGGF